MANHTAKHAGSTSAKQQLPAASSTAAEDWLLAENQIDATISA